MGLHDAFNYLLFNNPVSKNTISGVDYLVKATGLTPKSTSAVVRPMTTAASSITPAAWRILGKNYWFIRLAGLSGASAVALAAYGRHALKNEDKEIRGIYESANQMHLIHSVVLLAVPLAKRPVITGSLFVVGTALFSGTCYFKAIKRSQGQDVTSIPTNLAPYGGICLILGWLSLVL